MNISSLLLSPRLAHFPGSLFLSHRDGCCMGLGFLGFPWSRPVPASLVPAAFLPQRPPPPRAQLAAAASPSQPALLFPAPPPRPLPAQDCVPGIMSCGLKSPPFLCWMCSVCASFPRVREDAWGCAGMNLGRGAYFPPGNCFCVFFIPLSPPPLHTLYFKRERAGGWSTRSNRFIAAIILWKLSLEKEE